MIQVDFHLPSFTHLREGHDRKAMDESEAGYLAESLAKANTLRRGSAEESEDTPTVRSGSFTFHGINLQ